MLRVSTSSSIHTDAIVADALLFCYPRARHLVEQYLCAQGAADIIVFISHRTEWQGEHGYRQLFLGHFTSVIEISSSADGLPVVAEYEMLCLASSPIGLDRQRESLPDALGEYGASL